MNKITDEKQQHCLEESYKNLKMVMDLFDDNDHESASSGKEIKKTTTCRKCSGVVNAMLAKHGRDSLGFWASCENGCFSIIT